MKRGAQLCLSLSAVVIAAASAAGCSRRAISTHAQPLTVTVTPPVSTFSPPSQKEGSGFYATDAASVLHAALERAAGALESGKLDHALKALEDDALDRKTGVVVERYLARRIDVPAGVPDVAGVRHLGQKRRALIVSCVRKFTLRLSHEQGAATESSWRSRS